MLLERGSDVDAVVRSEIEEENVLVRIDTLRFNTLKDAVFSTADTLELVVHDCTGSCRSIVTEITSKTRDSRNENDDSEFAALLSSVYNCFNDSSSNLIVHRTAVVFTC